MHRKDGQKCEGHRELASLRQAPRKPYRTHWKGWHLGVVALFHQCFGESRFWPSRWDGLQRTEKGESGIENAMKGRLEGLH